MHFLSHGDGVPYCQLATNVRASLFVDVDWISSVMNCESCAAWIRSHPAGMLELHRAFMAPGLRRL